MDGEAEEEAEVNKFQNASRKCYCGHFWNLKESFVEPRYRLV